MRLFGQHLSSSPSSSCPTVLAAAALAVATLGQAAQAQTAPYVLPYTMTTYAGGNAAYSAAGNSCAPTVPNQTNPIAIDTSGDGCYASQVSVGGDPHDLRVDGTGNIFYIDATSSSAVVHKINPFTQLETVYVGNELGQKICASQVAPTTKYGDGCYATDGVANSNGGYTLVLKNVRGLGMATNGDLFIAGYGDYDVHKIAQSTGFMSLIAGSKTAASPGGYGPGAPGSNSVDQARGVTADANGNVYIDDTGNNALRLYTLSTNYLGLGLNAVNSTSTSQTKGACASSPCSFSSQQYLAGPEDTAIDTYGNIYIADASNNVIRAVYNGTGTLPGISAPITGQSYIVAGYYTTATYTTPPPDYPMNGSAPVSPTSVYLGGPRKISLDLQNNLYIADANYNVVWFVDHTTGYIRALAGSYGQAASTGATKPAYICAAATNNIGDGCPATQATIYSTSAGSAGTAMGISPDNQSNLYLTDGEFGSTAPTNSRIRKVLSGLNFPATTVNTAATTQTVLIHFAVNDKPATSNPFVLAGTGTDFTLGTSTCNAVNADNTTDCTLQLNFKPSVPGYDTATLTITSAKGGVNSYLVTGTGSAAPAIAFDPGNTALLSPTVNNPQGIALDPQGNAYIADTANNRVLYYNVAAGTTTIFAGTGSAGNSGNGGPATSAQLNGPKGVAIDTSGSVYIADTGNNVIRKVNASGIISLYAGAGSVCANPINTRGDGCPALQATFNAPTGLAADYLGNLYVADTGNGVVRQISTNTNVLTLASGSFTSPTGLAFDFSGKNLYVADPGSDNVYKINLGTTYTVTGTNTVSNIAINPVTLVAGNGTAGTTVNNSGLGLGSQLNAPTGVAVDAAENVYIADTGNHSIRMVNAANGFLSTIVGITGTSGTGTVGGAATVTQLTSPGGLAVTPLGTVFVLDSGNNRVLADTRSQISYSFGRVNETFPSAVQNFTELNIGNASTTLPTPAQGSPVTANSQFTLVSQANETGIIAGCVANAPFSAGSICNLQGQFIPTALGAETVTYTLSTTAPPAISSPSITLTGTGALQTITNSAVMQSSPALPTNSQYGASLTLTATITPVSCNAAAPACYPSGFVNLLVDGSVVGAPQPINGSGNSASASLVVPGLAVGNHTLSCNYLGDFYYATSTCPNVTITVAQASTTAVLSATNSGAPQYPKNNCTTNTGTNGKNGTYVTSCIQTTLIASVTSNTIGTPTGTVAFYAIQGTTTTPLGTSALSGSPASTSLTLEFCYTTSGSVSPTDAKGNACDNNILPPGTYTLTCTYNGAANFAISNCANITFVVLPQTGAISIQPPVLENGNWYSGVKPCVPSSLYISGSFTPVLSQSCPNITNASTGTAGYTSAGTAVVAIAQGSTTDATIFLVPSNTLTENITFSCSGLPADSTCTFSPTSIALTPGTEFPTPVYVDVTFWNDLQPGSVPGVGRLRAPTLGHSRNSVVLAEMIGWPLTLAGLFLLLRLRRRSAALKLLTLLLLMAGSTLTFTGCAGPGDYQAVLTPTGTYPVTVTATNGTVSTSVVIDYVVNTGINPFE